VKCPRCNGHGVLKYKDVVLQTCVMCNGKGEVLNSDRFEPVNDEVRDDTERGHS